MVTMSPNKIILVIMRCYKDTNLLDKRLGMCQYLVNGPNTRTRKNMKVPNEQSCAI